MNIVRNCINVIGLTPEEQLPSKNNGQIIIYDEVKNILIPENRAEIKTLFQIIVDVVITSQRIVNTPLNRLVILDGINTLKLVYSQNDENEEAAFLELQTPYNSYVELPKNKNDIEEINVYIVDVYLHKLTNRAIYSYFLYLIDVKYKNQNSQSQEFTYTKRININDEAKEEKFIEKMYQIKNQLISKEKNQMEF